MKLFQSATVKLALWYLLILMSVSLLFSAIVVGVARSELDTRLNSPGWRRQMVPRPDEFNINEQLDLATISLIVNLTYINLVVFIGGGAGAYFLARHTLEPIEKIHHTQANFVANASHQLRTPLAIITAETELTLSDAKSTKQELRANLTSNLEEAKRLSDLTTMLLDLSRLEQGIESQKITVDMVELTQTIINSRDKARFVITSPATLPLRSHHTAIRELLTILIDNSLSHSPPETPITITMSRHKQQLNWSIANEGQIAPSDLEHIFERFYQVKQSGGYGLGLALARHITETLGGTIEVKSHHDQVIFTLRLPIA